MSDVLDFVREKDPRFKDVPDAELAQFIGSTSPDFLQDPEFGKEFSDAIGLTAAMETQAAAKPVGAGPETPFGTSQPTPTLGELTGEKTAFDVRAGEWDPDRPVVKLGDFLIKPPEQAKTKFEAGINQELRDTINGMMTPDNLALLLGSMGIAATGATAARLVAALWAGFMGKHAVEDAPKIATDLGTELGKNRDQIDMQKVGQLLTRAGVQTAFTVAPALGAVHPTPMQKLARGVEADIRKAEFGPVEEAAALPGVPPIVRELAPQTAAAMVEAPGGVKVRYPLKPAVEPKAPLPNVPRGTFAPEVPETLPEAERGINVVEEIQAAGAKTIADIQRLFPQAQLNREAARRLRDKAWPEQTAEQRMAEADPRQRLINERDTLMRIENKSEADLTRIAQIEDQLQKGPNAIYPEAETVLRPVREPSGEGPTQMPVEGPGEGNVEARRQAPEGPAAAPTIAPTGPKAPEPPAGEAAPVPKPPAKEIRLSREEVIGTGEAAVASIAKRYGLTDVETRYLRHKERERLGLSTEDFVNPEEVASEIGFTFRAKEQSGAFKLETLKDLTPKQLEEFKSIGGGKAEWEFTDTRRGSPTEGRTFYVPEGASREQILKRFQEKMAEEPPRPPAAPPAPPAAPKEWMGKGLDYWRNLATASGVQKMAPTLRERLAKSLGVANTPKAIAAKIKQRITEIEAEPPKPPLTEEPAPPTVPPGAPETITGPEGERAPEMPAEGKAQPPRGAPAPLPATILGRSTQRLLDKLATKHDLTLQQAEMVLRAFEALPEGAGAEGLQKEYLRLAVVADMPEGMGKVAGIKGAKAVLFDLLHRTPEEVTIDKRLARLTKPAKPSEETIRQRRQKAADVGRPWDLIDELEGEFGGTINLTEVRQNYPNFNPIGAARKLFSVNRGFGPDVAMLAIEKTHPFGSVDAFLDALVETAKGRKTWRQKFYKEKTQLDIEGEQQLAFEREANKAGKDKQILVPDELFVGSKFELGGTKFEVKELRFDENGDVESVILEDGKKYGTRQVEAGTILNIDKGTLERAEPSTEFLPPGEVFERIGSIPEWASPELKKILEYADKQGSPFKVSVEKEWDKLSAEQKQELVARGWSLSVDRMGAPIIGLASEVGPNRLKQRVAPKLRPGEKAGEIFQGPEQPFNLAGEKGVDAERIAREKAEAERRAAEAAELEKKQQQDLFGEEKPPEGPEGPQGAVAAPGPGLQPTAAPAPTLTPKGQHIIIKDLAKGLGVPIRFGRLRTSKFAGYFLPRANLIGSRRATDMPIATHEVGHKLDQMFSISGNRSIRSELDFLGSNTRPGSRSSWTPSKTLKYKYGEGVAEFVRYWLTDPTSARNMAPNTHAFFENILAANKDLADVMLQAQHDIQTWRNAPAQARMMSHVSVGTNPNKTPYTLSQLTRDLVDDLHFVRLATLEGERLAGRKLLPSENPYLLMRNLRGSYGMAATFIRDGVVDFKTKQVRLGTSLEDALKPVQGRLKDFRAFAVAKRANEMHGQGRETGFVSADTQEVFNRYKNDQAFNEAFNKVRAWNDALLQYAVDSGFVTAASARAMRRMNRDYVPFHRLFEVGAGEPPAIEGGGTGRGMNVGKPGSLRTATGSVRPVIDPLETMVKNAYAIITAAEKSAVNEAVAKLGDLPGMGKWVEHVKAPMERIGVGIEKLKKQLEDAGADLEDVPEDLFLTFYRNSGRAPFGENIIRVVRNGKAEFYRLDKDLFETFHALDLDDAGKLVRMIGAPAQLLRAGVILDPAFSLANALRDTFSAATISKYGALPFETTVKGVFALLNDPKLVAEWAASGGKMAVEGSYFDRSKLQTFLKERVTKDLTLAEQAMIYTKSPFAALRWLTSIAEEATRIGEYKIALEKLQKAGMPEGEARRLAAFEARDRQDFAKGGAKTKIMRHWVPFWNAGLQGEWKLAQSFKERPGRTLLQGLGFITVAKLAEQAINWDDDDYWDRPQWERDLFFLIPVGKDKGGHTRFARLPTAFGAGLIFGTLPGRLLQWYKQNKPEAATSFPKLFLQQMTPNPIPQPVQVVVSDFLTGEKGYDMFRGRTVVPESLAALPPEMQWTEQTSLTARNVGNLFNFSPMKVDHIIATTTGGLGRQVTHQIIDRAIQAVTDQKRTAKGTVPGGRFVTTPAVVASQSIEEFYRTLTDLRKEHARAEAGGQPKMDIEYLPDFDAIAKEMAALRKTSKDPTVPEEQRDEAAELILQLARATMKEYLAAQKK